MSTPEAQQVLRSADEKMKKAAQVTHDELNRIRTGRASPSFVENLMIDAYGTTTPLNQLATINVPEPRLLVVQPYDRSIIGAIEKAIMSSDLGVTPSNDGDDDPAPVPAAHRRASQGAREGRAPARPKKDASRSATSAGTRRTSSRSSRRTARSARTSSSAPRRISRRRPTSTSPRSTSSSHKGEGAARRSERRRE